MKNLLLFSATFAFCLLAASHAQADTYTINFNQNSSDNPTVSAPTGSFTYDAGTFSNFVVTFGGETFNFTASANSGFGSISKIAACQFTSTFQYLTTEGACGSTTYRGSVASMPGTGDASIFFNFLVPTIGQGGSAGVAFALDGPGSVPEADSAGNFTVPIPQSSSRQLRSRRLQNHPAFFCLPRA